jgi:amino acid adenylation domain-containing protein
MSTGLLKGFRLSPQQRWLWRLQQRQPMWPARSWCSIRVDGPLDPALLRRALDAAWTRHEILRTYFPPLPGMAEPVQAIAEPQPLAIEERSLIDLAPEEQESVIERFASESPDGSQATGVRIQIVRLTSNRHLLLAALPMLCADARTLGLLAGEIGELYSALLQDGDLQAPPFQYADISQWLNDLLESDTAGAGRSYWKQNLPVDLPSVELPFQRPAADGKPGDWRAGRVPLSRKFMRQLDETAARIGCPRPAVLLAGLAALVWRFTDNSDFVLACESDGRRLEELQTALGPLARDLPLVCRTTESTSFAEFANDFARRIAEQEQWQEYLPFDPGNDSGERIGAPSPTIGFEYRKLPDPVLAGGTSFSVQSVEVGPRVFPLRVACTEQGGSFGAQLHYHSSRFSDEAVQYFADSYVTLLGSAMKAPKTSIARLEILDEHQRSQLVAAFNDTRNGALPTAPLHRLFEEQARQTPNRTALIGNDQALSFGETNVRANRIAHRLRALGVAPDSVVGVLLERSIETVVALLGVWKAGGAYLPLEASTPRERQKYMLQDAGASALLTGELFRGEFSDSCPAISIEETREDSALPEQGNLPGGAGLDNLAYVIYTSGSTGQPKGIAVEHRQLSNYVNAIMELLQPPEHSSFATVSTFAADLGHTAIFPPLISGGCLHVIAQNLAIDPDALSAYFGSHAVDYLKIVPSHLGALLSGSDPERLLPRRCLLLGGEAPSWELVQRIRELAPGCRILNHYGPTETTVGATTYSVGSSEVPVSRTVPIGRPLANVQVYVLDRYLEPVPMWAPGELYIGGTGVARGYQNRTDLTRERFLSDPFRPGNRMYRTGDLARFLADGNVEFLGRVDDQVKIRGFRIEPGEVQAILSAHAGVRENIVAVREDTPGERRLVAYVVPAGSGSVNSEALLRWVKTKLPDYMVPSDIVMMKALPLTPNGKVDRHGLPPPERALHARAVVAPRTPTERAVAQIWSEVLGVETIGAQDNFFDLGGHSLLVMQVVSRMRKAFRRELPIRWLFESPTVAELAYRTDSAEREEIARILDELERLPESEANEAGGR